VSNYNPHGLKRKFVLPIIQKAAFTSYFLASKLRVFKFSFVEKLFVSLYFLYKSRIENFDTKLLDKFITSNSSVVDVGANVGWFTVQIAENSKQKNIKIFSVEPGEQNLRRLKATISKFGLQDVVEVIPQALSDKSGSGVLNIDPKNPANHQVQNGESGFGEEIELIRLDDLKGINIPISLIKVDVQGHEFSVLKGAIKSIMRDRPALLIEIDNQADPTRVLEIWNLLQNLGYSTNFLFNLDHTISFEELQLQPGYFDVLCIPKEKVV
jgi:FkbM family methyltransferase